MRMKAAALLILTVFLAGCTSTVEEKQVDCPADHIPVGGQCCLDYDGNGVCDTEDAVKEAQQIMSGACRYPEITDPRHPEYCCLDADNNTVCDYVDNLK